MTSRQRERRGRVRVDLLASSSGVHAARGGDGRERVRDERRLVLAAALRLGREIRGVRLDEEPVERHLGGRAAERIGLGNVTFPANET